MIIQLIEGEFNQKEAVELLTQMIQIKIKYHENKINSNENEEDIKRREMKIKKLQKELHELRNISSLNSNNLKIEAHVNINI